MTLHPDWKKILKHSWSLRLLAIAGILTGLEYAVPYLPVLVSINPTLLAVLTPITIAAASFARLVAQKSISGDRDAD